MKHTNDQFLKSVIEIDGNEYEGCTFISCTFVYRATGLTGFRNCTLSPDCNLTLHGAAGNTINLLRNVYSGFGDWGRTQAQAFIDAIIKNRPPIVPH